MKPADRRAEMVRRGITVSQIAQSLGVTQSHVSAVILGRRRSVRIEEAVAAAIERPVKKVFPPTDAPAQVA